MSYDRESRKHQMDRFHRWMVSEGEGSLEATTIEHPPVSMPPVRTSDMVRILDQVARDRDPRSADRVSASEEAYGPIENAKPSVNVGPRRAGGAVGGLHDPRFGDRSSSAHHQPDRVVEPVADQAGELPAPSGCFKDSGPLPRGATGPFGLAGPTASERAYCDSPATATRTRDRRGADLRFDSAEHQTYGNEGARAAGYTATYAPTPGSPVPFELTFGDIVMLSGDYFEPREKDGETKIPGNLFELARTTSDNLGKRVGTQDEILYAIYHAHPADPRFAAGGVWSNIVFSDDVKEEVLERYKRRAATNFEHFVDPSGPGTGGARSGDRSSAAGSYRALHEDAIELARQAKREGKSISEAMAHEAAAQHFLTDSFAAGHLRTPRASIAAYWNAKYPLFFDQLKKTIAQDVAMYINAHEFNLATTLGSVLDLENEILPAIDHATASLPPVGLGEIVSAMAHDDDNAEGLAVTNGLGQKWKTYGDSHGGTRASAKAGDEANTKRHVEQAVALGIADIQHAYAAAQPASREEVYAEVKRRTSAPAFASQDTYGPEQAMPVLDPTGDNGTQVWQVPDFESLWNTPIRGAKSGKTFGDRIRESMANGSFRDHLTELADKFPVEQAAPGRSLLHPRVAYTQGFLAHILRDPKAKIRQILNFDPGRGQATVRKDDATRADLERLERHARSGAAPGPSGLTLAQRVSYVRNLASTNGVGTSPSEAEHIMSIFETATPAERRQLYRLVEGHGWSGEFRSGILGRVGGDLLWQNLSESQRQRLDQLLEAL